jgi:hypothetical protein
MTSQELCFDFRDLAVAASDSCLLLPSLLRDLVEPPAVTVKRGLLTGQLLPARDYDIDVLGIKLEAVADALGQFR